MKTRLGKYEIQAELGRGAFGRVYRAYDPTVGRLVAVKVMTTEGDKDLLARFRHEAAAAGNLRHKNIVTIYEFGEHEGVPFIVMEYLEGEDLQHALARRQPLSLLQRVSILTQVAEGLHCAHRNGVIHRDIKPANIMLQPDGTVKIMDFGIARLNRDSASRLTQKGHLLGTLLYMSPEQFRSAFESDALCDIFAYGVIGYELLAGRHPFQEHHNDGPSLMYKMINEDPASLRKVAPECPEALERIVHHALARERELRYHSLEDTLLDLHPILAGLKREGAALLVEEARRLAAGQQFEPAQSLIREILELDPASEEGRRLRERVQQELQALAVRPKVAALLAQAEEELSRRRPSDALQSLEEAAKLDRTNPQIESRLQQVRQMAEQGKRAARLLAEARRELARQQLPEARQRVCEVLREDPGNSAAAALLESLQQEQERRDRERTLQEGLGKAKRLVALQSFDTAIAILSQLEAIYRDSPQVTQLLARARSEKANLERKQRLLDGLAAAKQRLEEERFEPAVKDLEALHGEFPEDEELANLLAYAREEWRQLQRVQAAEAIRVQALQLSQAEDFEGALRVVRQGLRSMPEEPELLRLEETLVAARASARHVTEVCQQCGQLRQEKRYAQALDLVLGALEEHPGEPLLDRLREDLERELEQQRREEAVREAAETAQELERQDRSEEAIGTLRQALARYAGEPGLAVLLAEMQQRQAAVERERATAEALGRVEAFRQQGRFADALRLVESEAALAGVRDRLRQELEQEVRAAGVRLASEQARRLIEENRYLEAIVLLEQACSRYPGETELASLLNVAQEEMEKQRRAQRIERSAAEAQALLQQRDFKGAIRVLQEALESLPDEVEKAARDQEETRPRQESAEAVRQAVTEAQRWLDQEAPDKALVVLQRACAEHPLEQELQSMLQMVQESLQAPHRLQEIEWAEAEARALLDSREHQKAVSLLEQTLHRYSDEPGLVSLLDTVRSATVADEQARAATHRSPDLRPRWALAIWAAGGLLVLVIGMVFLWRQPAPKAPAKPPVSAGQRDPQAWEKLFREAEQFSEQGQYDAAIEVYKRVLDQEPGNTRAQEGIASAKSAKEAEAEVLRR